jgi:hypothetical protein
MINRQVLIQKLLEISCASVSFSLLLLLLCQKAIFGDDDMIPHVASIINI